MKTVPTKEFIRLVSDSTQVAINVAKIAQAETVAAVYLNIVANNPVLTGLSRRNWLFSLNERTSGTVDEVAGVTYTGAPPTDAELTRLNTFIQSLESKMLGQKAWIQNNVDYIERLEDGYSKKAPQGIVELAIMQALMGAKARTLKKAKDKLKGTV